MYTPLAMNAKHQTADRRNVFTIAKIFVVMFPVENIQIPKWSKDLTFDFNTFIFNFCKNSVTPGFSTNIEMNFHRVGKRL